MKHIKLPNSNQQKLSFYLAMEEYVASTLTDDECDDCFFLWQVEPTVIFGRHQVIENEVNLEYCKANGIQTYRRKSGGGCVYADRNNVMLSYITRNDNVEKTFSKYLALVAEALQSILGISAVATSNNDLLIEGAKVSGNAIYHTDGKIIAHGTLLYDTVMKNMISAITPSREKLQKHGVESVRQRITLLKEHTDMPLEEIKARLIDYVCSDQITLNEEDVEKIKQIEKTYLDPDFIKGSIDH
ncbi:MAG: lipoate--protein ligase family protein [Bacteroidales bacterium]|nr:lipoate--protein ligase family protein [Bacteroidales bacterium]